MAGEGTVRREPRRPWPFALAATVLCLGLLAGLSSCGRGTGTGTTAGTPPGTGNVGVVEGDEAPTLGGKIVYGLVAETNGWNPSTNQWGPSGMQVARSIFDLLAAYDADANVHPFAAERFTHNEALTEWTIELRPGMRLHNGKAVTADLVKRGQEVLMRSPIVGGAYGNIESYTATGELTLVVHMKEPWGSYPQSLATQIGAIADPDWLASNDGLHPIGSGPFVFDRWEVGHELVVKKNPDYWRTDARGNRLPYLDEVDYTILTDGASRAASLDAHNIDILQTTDATTIADFRDRTGSDFQVFTNATGETLETFVMLNASGPPFDDVDARRALAYGTNQRALIDDIHLGIHEPATGAYSKSSKWYAPTDYPPYDPVEARRLVDTVKARHGSFSFTLAVGGSSTEAQRELQWFQQQFTDIGIDVKVEAVEQAKEIIQVVTGQYQAVLWQQFDSPHPIDDSIFWLPRENRPPPAFSLNFARLSDDQIQDALDRARRTDDPAVELAAYQDVQRRQAELVPYVWMYHLRMAIIASDRLVNVVRSDLPDGARGVDLANGSHPVAQIWLRTT